MFTVPQEVRLKLKALCAETVYQVHSGTLQYLGLDNSEVPVETLVEYLDMFFSGLVCQRVQYVVFHMYVYSFEHPPSPCGRPFHDQLLVNSSLVQA